MKTKTNFILNLFTFLFVLSAMYFFVKEELALLFLGNHPIEMSYRRAIVVDGENASYLFSMGILREKLADDVQDETRKKQRYQDALNSIKEAIRLNPYQLTYRVTYGNLALKAGFPEKGEEVFQIDPLAFDFEFFLARSYYYFTQASQESGESRGEYLKKGAEDYQIGYQIAGPFAKDIFTHKTKLLPEDVQPEAASYLELKLN